MTGGTSPRTPAAVWLVQGGDKLHHPVTQLPSPIPLASNTCSREALSGNGWDTCSLFHISLSSVGAPSSPCFRKEPTPRSCALPANSQLSPDPRLQNRAKPENLKNFPEFYESLLKFTNLSFFSHHFLTSGYANYAQATLQEFCRTEGKERRGGPGFVFSSGENMPETSKKFSLQTLQHRQPRLDNRHCG